MKIAHFVTYISPDGAYGGPTRVALGQAAGLVRAGHEVAVYAAAPIPKPKTQIDDSGVAVHLFPAVWIPKRLGYASMRAPSMLQRLRDICGYIDVAHVHLARDLVTLPAARFLQRRGIPIVVQTHGMVDESDRLLAPPVDALLTKPVLRHAARVLTLTSDEEVSLRHIEPSATLTRIGNGVEIRPLPEYEERPNRVLFLARLHPRKRPLSFVEMAESLCDAHEGTEFVLVGPDEGMGARVSSRIGASRYASRIRWIGAVPPDETRDWMAGSRIYVLPAVDEIFPMTILEAFREGTPVVTTLSLGIAADCEHHGAAVLTDGSASELASAVGRLLNAPTECEALRVGGLAFLAARSNIEAVVTSLQEYYHAAVKQNA